MTLVYIPDAHPKIVRELSRGRSIVGLQKSFALIEIELDNELVIVVRIVNRNDLQMSVEHKEGQ